MKLLYTKDGGTTWKVIDNDLLANPGQFVWNVPLVNAPRGKCKIKLILLDSLDSLGGMHTGSDATDGYFTIQPAP